MQQLSQSQRASATRGAWKRYVLGWCVQVTANIGSFTEWTETLRKDGKDLCRSGCRDQSGIWTREQAISIATGQRENPANAKIGWVWTAREMIYETPNRENAEGLREGPSGYRPQIWPEVQT